MPLISVKTSAASPNGAALLTDLSSTLASLLGKPERYVMTLLEAEVEFNRQSQPSQDGFSLLGDTLPDARRIDGGHVKTDGRTGRLRRDHRAKDAVARRAVAVLTGLVVVVRRVRSDTSPIFWLRAGAAAGLLGAAVQGVWDTSLRLPANAALFAVAAALAVHERAAAHGSIRR